MVETVRSTSTGALLTNRYTEIGNGLNYQDAQGNWIESRPVVQSFPGGIVCTGNSYRVIISSPLGTVDMETSDHKRVISQPIGLAFYDRQTGDSLLLAQLRADCEGEVISNRIVFRDAFQGTNGIQASIVYGYDIGRFHQDIIFTRWPAGLTPMAFGMSAESRLEIWTEMLQMPQPNVTVRVLRQETNALKRASMAEPDLVNERISFGEMVMPLGRAFLSESSSRHGVLVVKRLLNSGGRNVLIEGMEWRAAQPELSKLPKGTASLTRHSETLLANAENSGVSNSTPSLQKPKGSPSSRALHGRSEILSNLPSRALTSTARFDSRLVELTHENPREVAANAQSSPAAIPTGFLADYEQVQNIASKTFESGNTYWMRGSPLIDDVVFQPGAILKFEHWQEMTIDGSVTCQTGSEKTIFTSYDDDSVGEVLPNSTHQVTREHGVDGLLYLDDLMDDFTLQNLDIRHAEFGIYVYSEGGFVDISNCRFGDCQQGVLCNVSQYGLGAYVQISDSQMCDVDTWYSPEPDYGYSGGITADNITENCDLFVPSWVDPAVSHIWTPRLGGGIWNQSQDVLDAIEPVLQEYPRPVLVGLRSDRTEFGYRFDLNAPEVSTRSEPFSGASQEDVLKILGASGNAEFIWSMPVPGVYSDTPYHLISDPDYDHYNSSGIYALNLQQDKWYKYSDPRDDSGAQDGGHSPYRLFVNGTLIHPGLFQAAANGGELHGPASGPLKTAAPDPAGEPTIYQAGAGYPWQTPEYYAAYLQYLIGDADSDYDSKVTTLTPDFLNGGEGEVGGNWANLRAKRDRVAPYSLVAVILGVEPWDDAQEGFRDDGAAYGDMVDQFRNAIRTRGGALASIPLGLCTRGNYPMSDFSKDNNWFRDLFNKLAPNNQGRPLTDFTYMDVYHPYRFDHENDEYDSDHKLNINRFFPGFINNGRVDAAYQSDGWQYSDIPDTEWNAGVDYKYYLWFFDDIRYALNHYRAPNGFQESAVRWNFGCAEHGMFHSSQNRGNDMGAGIHWALWLAGLMKYNENWDMNWVLAEKNYSHAQLQYVDGYLTRTPGFYVYKMAQEFYGYEYHENTYQSPSSSQGTIPAAPPDATPIYNYTSPDLTVRVFRHPADGHFHLFVINKNTDSSADIDGWENWTVVNWEQLQASSLDDQNPIGNPWSQETITIQQVSHTQGQPLTIAPISVNHIELEPTP